MISGIIYGMDSQYQKNVEKMLGGPTDESEASNKQAFAPYPSTPYDVENLPLVVWLRGDEPYFEQFSYDADQAMAELSIKRSRLTQISGKELRVGRVRMGRYIKPVFRPVDIEDYKDWTRPTATHRKSSTLIDEAIGVLKSKAEDYQSTLENTDFHQELKYQFDKFRSEAFKHINQLQKQNNHMQGAITKAKGAFSASIQGLGLEKSLLTIEALEKQNKDLHLKLENIAAIQEKSTQLLCETLHINKTQNESHQIAADAINTKLESLHSQVAALLEVQESQSINKFGPLRASSILTQADRRRLATLASKPQRHLSSNKPSPLGLKRHLRTRTSRLFKK